MERHTAQPLVPEPIPFEVKIAIANLESINRQVLIKLSQN
jgi:hypothetical protein